MTATLLAEARVLLRGEVTLFLATPDGHRVPIVTLVAPALVVHGESPDGRRWIERPSLDSTIERLDASIDPTILDLAVGQTVDLLSELVRPEATPPPERIVRLDPRPTYVAAGRAAITAAPAWVRAVEGQVTLAGRPLPAGGGPLGERLALYSEGYTAVSANPLDQAGRDQVVEGVAWLVGVAADVVERAGALGEAEVAERMSHAAEREAATRERAVRLLAAELGSASPPPPAASDPLVACAIQVGAADGLVVNGPRLGLRGREGAAAVRAIAAASRVYARRVRLRGDWWNDADRALLGFRHDGTPLALIPDTGRLVGVEAGGTRHPIDASNAGEVLDVAFSLTAPLRSPDVDSRTLLRLALHGRRNLVATILGWSIVIAAVSSVLPLASGVVFGEIIPESDRGRLGWLIAALTLVALAGIPLQLVFISAVTRFEAAASLDVQRSVWGRVLGAPVSFVKLIGAGDLAVRLGGLETIRDPVDQALLRSIPTVLSGFVAGGVLLWYDARLALVMFGFGLLLLAAVVVVAILAAHRQRELEVATGSMNGFLLQVLTAIPKLRVAAAESRAFLAWAERFRGVVGRPLMLATARLNLLMSLISTLGALVLFAATAAIGPDQVPVSRFLAFQLSYTIFLAGVSALAGAISTVAQQRPTVQRAVEVAKVPMESGPTRGDPGPLRGSIAVTDVTFRYVPTQRPVLDGLSFRVEPGEMVAIAGRSGCGKSTIMRLLLGFEQPESGSVLLDDQDLTSLDVEAVRRQMGVVLQDGQLLPGTIAENLAGVASLSTAELWELAEIVALADDIRAMPMALETPIMLNGGAFSGGQRQRLVIARALAARPRILLLDEATSALDNVTQRVITNNLAHLGMTRIVVAHRLSTMADADRLLVLDGGRVAEQGTYDELIARRGAFWALAERQML